MSMLGNVHVAIKCVHDITLQKWALDLPWSWRLKFSTGKLTFCNLIPIFKIQ